jgi:hypothetical protein
MAAPKKGFKKTLSKLNRTRKAFLARRPHRSFRRTRRRDYKRSLKLPGYFAFTYQVHKTLWQYKKAFLIIGIVYSVLIFIFTNVMSDATYQSIANAVQGATDNWSNVGNAALTLALTIASSSSPTTGSGQQIGSVAVNSMLALLIWLTIVWYLRNKMANRNTNVRDAFYNAGAPIVATFGIFIIGFLQLIPAALAVMATVAGIQTGLVNNGAAAMLLTLGVALLFVLSLFWITATLMGLVVVTLPGMYPLRALSIAGDMVVGRRIKLLLRFGWVILFILICWALIMIPIIMLDSWLKQAVHFTAGVPIVPAAIVLLSSFTLMWFATYVYLLYRKVVDDDALPA